MELKPTFAFEAKKNKAEGKLSRIFELRIVKIFQKNGKKSLKMCKKLGGRRLRLKYGPRLVSGKLHGELEPVASFWRQQKPKSAMFLASLVCPANNMEHFLQ